MSTRCYEDFCLPDNSFESVERSSGVALFLLAVVFAGLLTAALSNVDLSSLDFTNIVDNPFGFPF